MAKAKKLPSGSWRVLQYDGRGPDGKRIYKSFTARTKKEAERAAAAHRAGIKRQRQHVTVADAIERYISSKSAVLSPSTVRGYRQLQGQHYEAIGRKDINNLTEEDVQRFVSDLTERTSPKTVSNAYSLLRSSLKMFMPVDFNVTLPRKDPRRGSAPMDHEVRTLFDTADHAMKVVIALAAFGSLRRGEMCALKFGDVQADAVSVHADIVENEHNQFEYKELPKTDASIRMVPLPGAVVDLIGNGAPDDFIISRTPNAVTHAFTRLRNKVGINIKLHDLRHYYASVGAALGIPDVYLSEFGGWERGSRVLKSVYQGTQEDKKTQFAGILTDHFESIMQHEMQHDDQKA